MMDAVKHNTEENINRLFSNPNYVRRYRNPARMKFYRDVVELLRSKGVEYDGKHIADMGCATGDLLKYVSDNYNHWYISGFDFSFEAIKWTHEHKIPRSSFILLNLMERIPIEADVVFCTKVLEHQTDPTTMLNNILTTLTNHGVAIFMVPDGRYDGFWGHIQFWTSEEWNSFMCEACKQHLYEFTTETGVMDDFLWAIVWRSEDA